MLGFFRPKDTASSSVGGEHSFQVDLNALSSADQWELTSSCCSLIIRSNCLTEFIINLIVPASEEHFTLITLFKYL